MRGLLIRLIVFLALTSSASADTLTAATTGNFTTAGTWRSAATGAGEITNAGMVTFCAGGLSAGATSANNSWDGANFTIDNGEVLEGVVVFVDASGSTGTLTVDLSDNGTTNVVRSVTIPLADLPQSDGNPTHVFMKFSSTYTADGGNDYRFGWRVSSGSSGATGYSNCTSNWWHYFPTDVTAAPAAGDQMHVIGNHDGTTYSAVTVTMDNTATTDFGYMNLGYNGTLAYGTSASTNYYLKLSGNLSMRYGTFTMGTVATPVPGTSTAVLEFDCGSDGEFGVQFYVGTWNMVGSPRTSGKNVTWTTLTANEAAASTSIDVAADTGWLDTDEVGFGSTSRTYSQYENRVLSGNAGASSFSITAGLTNAHDGTAPSIGEVVLLTRNVILRSASSTNYTYWFGGGPVQGTTVETDPVFKWAAFKYVGINGDGKYTLDFRNYTTGSTISITYCSFWKSKLIGLVLHADVAPAGYTIEDNVFYDMATGACGGCNAVILKSRSSTTTTGVFSRNAVVGSQTDGIRDEGSRATMVGNRSSSHAQSGFQFVGTDGATPYWRTFEGNTSHSNAAHGIQFDSGGLRLLGSSGSYNEFWRNNSFGFNLAQAHMGSGMKYAKAWGNASGNFQFVGGHFTEFAYLTANGETSYTTPYGIWFRDTPYMSYSKFSNMTIGVASGSMLTHSSCDIFINGMIVMSPNYILSSTLGSATEICAPFDTYNGFPAWIFFDNIDGDPDRSWAQSEWGVVAKETTVVDAGSSSISLTPTTTAFNYLGGLTTHLNGFISGWKAAVENGNAPTITVRIRTSAAYNGATEPQIWVAANPAIGINADAAIGTFAGSDDTWTTVTGTPPTPTADGVMEFYVRTTGTLGITYVDTVEIGDLLTVDLGETGTWYTGYSWITALASAPAGGGETSAPF